MTAQMVTRLTLRSFKHKTRKVSNTMLMLLAKFELMGGSIFFKNKEIGFPLKPDDVIVMSSKVHEWKGKRRYIDISV